MKKITSLEQFKNLSLDDNQALKVNGGIITFHATFEEFTTMSTNNPSGEGTDRALSDTDWNDIGGDW